MKRKGALAADPTSCDWVLAFDLMNDIIITMAAAARPSASLPTTHRLVYFGPRAPTLQITLFVRQTTACHQVGMSTRIRYGAEGCPSATVLRGYDFMAFN